VFFGLHILLTILLNNPDIISHTGIKATGAFKNSPRHDGAPNHVILNELLTFARFWGMPYNNNFFQVPSRSRDPSHASGKKYSIPVLPRLTQIPLKPHEDGPRYHPVVATISLGSHTVFHYYKYKAELKTDDFAISHEGKIIDMSPVLSVLLEPRSLIISSGTMYTSHLHG
jgi:alkylated DNA repair protein alkB homolog 6